MRINLTAHGMSRPDHQSWHLTSPAGSALITATVTADGVGLILAIADADPGITATISYESAPVTPLAPQPPLGGWGPPADYAAVNTFFPADIVIGGTPGVLPPDPPHPDLVDAPDPVVDAALADEVDRMYPPGDEAALRRGVAYYMRELRRYVPDGGSEGPHVWVLYDGQAGDQDDDESAADYTPLLVVFGSPQDAQTEADRMNLERLADAGSLRAVDVVHVLPTTVPVVWGDTPTTRTP